MRTAVADRRLLANLRNLYAEIYRCARCVDAPGCRIVPDPERVRRQVVPRALDSEVFLVGQSLGGRTQRRSGLPYCLPNGSLSQAGRGLDAFLGAFGYTIEPQDMSRRYAYHSDIIQHYPGRAGRGDREPMKAERDNCAEWLKLELLLVRPKVALLLGEVAARDFLGRYGNVRVRELDAVWGLRFGCQVEEREVTAFPLPHFSYRFGDRGHIADVRHRAAAAIQETLT